MTLKSSSLKELERIKTLLEDLSVLEKDSRMIPDPESKTYYFRFGLRLGVSEQSLEAYLKIVNGVKALLSDDIEWPEPV